MLAHLQPAVTADATEPEASIRGVCWLLTRKTHILEPSGFFPQTVYLGIIFSASPFSLGARKVSEFKV